MKLSLLFLVQFFLTSAYSLAPNPTNFRSFFHNYSVYYTHFFFFRQDFPERRVYVATNKMAVLTGFSCGLVFPTQVYRYAQPLHYENNLCIIPVLFQCALLWRIYVFLICLIFGYSYINYELRRDGKWTQDITNLIYKSA